MFLKFKLKKVVKIFLSQAGMDKVKISYILTQNLDQYVDSVKRLKNSPFANMTNQNCLERLLVSTAENYMNQLLDKDKLEADEDIIKIHFCIAVMAVVTNDQWTPMCNQILRLDLWYKHWSKINEIGTFIVKQPADIAPFIDVLNNLMVTNYQSGHLQLEAGFPLDEICNMVSSEYKLVC
jgi:hypothetical protein